MDFGKWYVRLIAGLVVFLVIFLVMTVFFGIMGLAVKQGEEVTLTFDGADEDAAYEAISNFMKENL